MYADLWCARVRLPPLALCFATRLQLDAQQTQPKAPSAVRVVGGKLDQGRSDGSHRPNNPTDQRTAGRSCAAGCMLVEAPGFEVPLLIL